MSQPDEGVHAHSNRRTDLDPPDADHWRPPRLSPWYLLLIPVVILPLCSFLWNSNSPALFGMPFFYWMQLLWVIVTALVVGLVYFKTKEQ